MEKIIYGNPIEKGQIVDFQELGFLILSLIRLIGGWWIK